MCLIRTKPSQLHTAQSFLISVFQPNGESPLDITGAPLNPIIGQCARDSPLIVDQGRTVDYRGFVPKPVLAPGRYRVVVVSPAEGPEANRGTGQSFLLQYPYVWVPTPYGACNISDSAYTCGVGISTRLVRSLFSTGPLLPHGHGAL